MINLFSAKFLLWGSMTSSFEHGNIILIIVLPVLSLIHWQTITSVLGFCNMQLNCYALINNIQIVTQYEKKILFASWQRCCIQQSIQRLFFGILILFCKWRASSLSYQLILLLCHFLHNYFKYLVR